MCLHATLIKQLGGRSYVAGALGLEIETVKSWQKRGAIPPRYWRRMAELAQKKGHEVTILQLEQASSDNCDPEPVAA